MGGITQGYVGGGGLSEQDDPPIYRMGGGDIGRSPHGQVVYNII